VEFQEEPFRSEDDLDVFVLEGVFKGRDGYGAHFGEAGFGGFSGLGGWVAELLHQRSGAVLKARVNAVNDEEGGADKLLGRREDIKENGIVNRLT
jgi:hypothetical protein